MCVIFFFDDHVLSRSRQSECWMIYYYIRVLWWKGVLVSRGVVVGSLFKSGSSSCSSSSDNSGSSSDRSSSVRRI